MAAMALLAGATSCNDRLDVENPNQQTTSVFGNTTADLEAAVIACYNHARMEGTYSRYGYGYDMLRGDEVYNAGQVWWLPADALNMPVTDEMSQWIWRDWYYTINVANYILTKQESVDANSPEVEKRIKGQAAFFRGQGYYMLAVHYQNVPIITNYKDYTSLESLYQAPKPQAEVLAQAVADLKDALDFLPTKEEGGTWAKGRATKAAAAALLAKVYMFQHNYEDAQPLLDNIISGVYGSYELVADFGANFREGVDENNSESIYEIQFLDYGMQGNDEEWTPVNNSKDATQAHAIESFLGPLTFSGWADNAASPWLYNLFKAEKTTDGGLDPRLYWTLGTYEKEYDQYTGQKTAAYPNGDPRKNVMYTRVVTDTDSIGTNGANGGIPICKNTNMRTGIYDKIVAGLRCGINLRIIRLADVLLLAAECENEINGPTAKAFGYINKVRNRAALKDLDQSKFSTKDALFEQIANVERPKELGCEFGRGIDLIRWGFFYDKDRLNQITIHGTARKSPKLVTDPITENMDLNDDYISSFKTWNPGHEYLPIYQGILNANPNMTGNSANNNEANTPDFTIHPVVEL